MAKGIAVVANLGEQHRSQHSIGHRHVTTADFGLLKPIHTMEVVPGDIISLDIKDYIQLAPNAAPLIGDIEVSLHAFYVPNRIMFAPFNEYITGLKDIDLPYVPLSKLTGTINPSNGNVTPNPQHEGDKEYKAVLSGLGLNPRIVYAHKAGSGPITNDINVSPFPFFAYERIWFDWFSNKNFVDSSQAAAYGVDFQNAFVQGTVDDWSEWMDSFFVPRFRCFGKDFITSALISPAGLNDNGQNLTVVTSSPESGSYANNFERTHIPSYDVSPAYEGDISIPQIRMAVAMQKWFEKANFIGKQTISRIKGMFGGNATPERLMMSEFLGASSGVINFENHAASVGTASDDTEVNAFGTENRAASSMMGQQYSQGNCSVTLNTRPYHVQEHGLIMVIMSVLPRPQYYQSLPRLFTRGVSLPDASRFDFYHPEFENVGFQPIYKHEVVNPVYDLNNRAQRGISDPFKIWGWQPKYEDYKYSMDVISGDFLEASTMLSMNQFHLGRDLLRQYGIMRQDGTLDPSHYNDNLDDITLEGVAQCDRAARAAFDDKFVVPSSDLDHFVCDIKIGVNASRPMQSVALPSLDGEKHDGSPVVLGGVRL